jgi:hypothetical protein
MSLNPGSVSSSLKPFVGEYRKTLLRGTTPVPMWDVSTPRPSGSKFIQTWSSWYEPTTGTGFYQSGSFYIRDTNQPAYNGKRSGGVFRDATIASKYAEGFMSALSQSDACPTRPSQTVLGCVDYTSVSESNAGDCFWPNDPVSSNTENFWGKNGNVFNGFFSSGGNAKFLQLFNLYRRNITNAYGSGGGNANPHYYTYWLSDDQSYGGPNGSIILYGTKNTEFTNLMRSIQVPIESEQYQTISSGMDVSGSIAHLVFGGLPVLQPKEIYGQEAMFLPTVGSNFSIEFAG